MKRLVLIFVSSFSLWANSAKVCAQTVDRIDPPHWWVGMGYDTLELLLYGQKLDKLQSVSIDHPGVAVLETELLPNPHYALVRVYVQPGAQPGPVDLRHGKRAKTLFGWQLHPRSGHQPRSMEPHDVVYLITPDRFANALPENDVVRDMVQNSVNRSDEWARHGGDIEGIVRHLDYLDNLGISTLWSSPLLENDQDQASYHGYAITDFYRVDPRFGRQSDLRRLSDALHERGMKHILDVVYNHCGKNHPFETDPPSADWINRWPEYTQTNYRAEAFIDPHASDWDKARFQDGWFVSDMPDLNQNDPHLARYLIQNTLWWIEEAHIDALRIDTYAYPDAVFMNRLVRTVRHVYPGFYCTGELWVHGGQIQSGWTANPMLGAKASALPSVLDFQFCFGLQDMFRKKPDWATGMGRFYLSLAGDWLYEDPFRMITFADNHDMGRIAGVLKGDVDRIEDALGVLLTSRGIPCIYYGTEVLMSDTTNHGKIRQDFPGGWEGDVRNGFTAEGRTAGQNRVHDYLRALALFRREHPGLFQGRFVQFVPVEGVYVYGWRSDTECLLAVLSRSDKDQTMALDRFVEVISDMDLGPFPGLNEGIVGLTPQTPSIAVPGSSLQLIYGKGR
ncbi:hypothetical protein GC167_06390 [bacterium]|nr:hypothetical protein [bacterium]